MKILIILATLGIAILMADSAMKDYAEKEIPVCEPDTTIFISDSTLTDSLEDST